MNLLPKLYYHILFGLFFCSCTLITEPDRIYNHEAYPPEYLQINFNELGPDQHVDGTIRIIFNPAGINYAIDLLRIFIDDVPYSASRSVPYVCSINTRDYTEGLHKVSFALYQVVKPHGLLNLYDSPSTIFDANLYFDRTPPDLVTLYDPKISKDGIQLNWSESSSKTFYAYLVYKSVDNRPFKLIDTIPNKHITEYSDTVGIQLIGAEYQYKIAVTSDYKLTYQTDSNIKGFIPGDPIRYEYTKFISGPFLNEELSEVNFLADDKLLSFSSIDYSLLKEVDLTDLLSGSGFAKYVFNNNKSKIYLYNSSGEKLWIINSSDFSVLKKITLPEGGSQLYVLDDSRIFFNSNYSYKIINIDENKVANSIDFMNEYFAGSAILNEDNSNLIINVNKNDGWYLQAMDVTNNNFNLIKSIKTYEGQFLTLLRYGNKIYCDGKRIYDAKNLVLLGYINIDERINSFSVSNDNIAYQHDGKYNIPGLYEVSTKRIVVYNSQSEKIKEWNLICGYLISLGSEKVFTGVESNSRIKNILGFSLSMGE